MSDESSSKFLSESATKITEILSGLNGVKRIEHLRSFIEISAIVLKVTQSNISKKDRGEFLEAIKNPLVSIAVVSFNPSVNPENL